MRTFGYSADMPRRSISDQAIFKAILSAGPSGTISEVARQLGATPSGINRRIQKLVADGYITVRPLGLCPKAIDLSAEHIFEPVELLVSFVEGQVRIAQP